MGPVPHDFSYYSKCMLGGVLACGVTHAGITPLDVAKCNMQVVKILLTAKRVHWWAFQVNPSKYKALGSAISTLVKEEGANGIWKGFGPTFVGYSLQGMFKYGLYEVFKDY